MASHDTLSDARGHYRIILIFAAFLLLAATGDGIRPAPSDDVKQGHDNVGVVQEEVYATGSSLPDCSHACGACSPCSRVMVSFKCSIAEPCPMVYRCMCKGKCYPVPSS
uniref:Epidermal patterning factor-like protein n=1 Tax=Leersia perrieri TaxID=77586 RepID=A0A0D9WA42_9ORYZ